VRPEVELLLACAGPQPATPERVRALAGQALDWDWLLTAARHHGVAPLLARRLGTSAPPALRTMVEDSTRRSLRLTAELIRLLDLLRARGIAAVALKGPALAMVAYGDVALRPCRDLDLLVARADLARAGAVLVAAGYSPPALTHARRTAALTASHHTLFTRDDGDIVELHWELRPPEVVRLHPTTLRSRLRAVRLGGTSVPTLGAEDHILHLCLHGASHAWHRLEWICDVAWFLSAVPLDWELLAREARALGARRALALGFRLANDLLDAPPPPEPLRSWAARRPVRRFAAFVSDRLFRNAKPDPSAPEIRWVQLGAQDRWRDRARALYHLAFTPQPVDWALVSLPDRLYPLYRLVRPLRLAAKFGAALIRVLSSPAQTGTPRRRRAT
jgi:putative nucleotidyltransferase-like protein